MQKIYKTYGLSMKGSKSKLADRIVSLFPRATHLYDLFCGGSTESWYQRKFLCLAPKKHEAIFS